MNSLWLQFQTLDGSGISRKPAPILTNVSPQEAGEQILKVVRT